MQTRQLLCCLSALLPALSQYVENVISYIAGFVVRHLLQKLKCSECRHLLVDAENVSAPTCSFLKLKNNRGLVVPSAGVVRVVQLCEQHFRRLTCVDQPVHAIARLGEKLQMAVLCDVDYNNIFSSTDHCADTLQGIDSHISSLIRQIVRFFLDIRTLHVARTWNDSQKGTMIRQSMTKLILFKNQ